MRGSRIRQWIGYLIIVSGLFVLASPFLTGFIDGKKQQSVVKRYDKNINRPEPSTKSPKGQGETAEEALEGDAFYEAALSYNEELYLSNQRKLVSTEATERFTLDPTKYGYADYMIGTIWIPRMDVELGLYLGANAENMSLGAGVFGQTCVPLGRMNENTSIAGHRGWKGTPMFRDIQKLQLGDSIYIKAKWGVLCYKVSELVITTPEDSSWCRIIPGESVVTLMSCHPYTKNYQRYVVYAVLENVLPPDALLERSVRKKIEQETKEKEDTSARTVTQIEADGTRSQVKVSPKSVEANGSEYGAFWSNAVILAEKQIRLITIGLTVFVILLGMSLIRATVRDRKKRKKKKQAGGIRYDELSGENQSRH